jgi:cysteine desulfurase
MAEAYASGNANASGQHGPARTAKNALEEAREQAAEIFGSSRPLDVVFTSGGTEADNLAVCGVALASEKRSIVISAVEHEAVLRSAESLERFGYSVVLAGVDGSCVVDPNEVASLVGRDTAVVSVMAANNEVGTVEPIRAIVEAVKGVDDSIPVHTDAAQAFVSEDITIRSTSADLISLSAHKFGGPKGVGLLVVDSSVRIDPVMHGGGQEAGRRSGTYNVPGIVGMVAAMREAVSERDVFRANVGAERDSFEQLLRTRLPTATVIGSSARRMVQHSHVHFPGVLAETLLIRLDQEGLAAGAGSACQSGAVEPSHVLTAMGMSSTEAGECVRFTFGWDTAHGEGATAAARVIKVIGQLT